MKVRIKVLESFAGPNGSYRLGDVALVSFENANSWKKANLCRIIDEVEEPEKPIANLITKEETNEEKTETTNKPETIKRKYAQRKKKTTNKKTA